MKLILIKHAMPVIDTSVAPPEWELSDEGRSAAEQLGQELSGRRIAAIVSSEEPKAAGTAAAVAGVLDLPWSTAPGLHEHVRRVMPWSGQEAWHALLQRFFERPDELVFGEETGSEALERFSGAVAAVSNTLDPDSGTLCIVSHGTVMSLFAARQLEVPPYSIWAGLRLPDYVELELVAD